MRAVGAIERVALDAHHCHSGGSQGDYAGPVRATKNWGRSGAWRVRRTSDIW